MVLGETARLWSKKKARAEGHSVTGDEAPPADRWIGSKKALALELHKAAFERGDRARDLRVMSFREFVKE